MTKLDKYLKANYLNADAFATHCDISISKLEALIDDDLIPKPSYVVTTEGKVISYPFGEMDAPSSTPGRYFHPKGYTWVLRALKTPNAKKLRERFSNNFAEALSKQNRVTWWLEDAFTDSGDAIETGLTSRMESAWNHFLQGTYCLCVADPSSEEKIAQKEILQEKLIAITDNGTNASPEGFTRSELINLIDEYASIAMPFSPVEYAQSSRKRIVEDLRKTLG